MKWKGHIECKEVMEKSRRFWNQQLLSTI